MSAPTTAVATAAGASPESFDFANGTLEEFVAVYPNAFNLPSEMHAQMATIAYNGMRIHATLERFKPALDSLVEILDDADVQPKVVSAAHNFACTVLSKLKGAHFAKKLDKVF
jgi:hypothetical protein